MRAIKRGLNFGPHGLPLIGCGDWNDGMNMIGTDGRGESVWLAFFLYDVLRQFESLARRRNDNAFADNCLAEAQQLQANIQEHAWDGEWYRRAYFDNGEPLGSKTNLECQIDSLPQSWSVISGAGDPERSRTAMQACPTRRRPSRTRFRWPSWKGCKRPTNRAVGFLGSKVGTRTARLAATWVRTVPCRP